MKTAKKQEIKLYITTEQNGFDMLTRNISRNIFLSAEAKELYIYINSHSETFNLSYESIANYFKKSVKTIKRAVDELKESGFLILERKPNANAYYYKLLKSPKIDQLKTFTTENIKDAFFKNIISLQDINQLRKANKITLKQYNEIINQIMKIVKTEWLNND